VAQLTQALGERIAGTMGEASQGPFVVRLDHPGFDGDRVIWLSVLRNEIERGREINRTGDRIVTRSLKLRGRGIVET
jgi:hypothetical protein